MVRFRKGCNHDINLSSATAVKYSARALWIALFALLLGAAWPLAAQTGSTKFIPTFLVYYGGGPALTVADAPKLAKFDLIDIDRFRYNSIGGNTWAAIKSINPNVQIYLYEMGPEAPSHLDSALQVSLNGLGRHNVSRGHPMGSLNGNHPELFQLDAAGNRIYSVSFSNVGANQYWYLMDFGSAAYQSYWATAVRADIADQPWVADGVFADNCLTFASAGGYSASSTRYPTNAAWSSAMNSFVTAISAGLHGYGQKLWCNKGDTRSADGVAAWLALDASATPPDVLLEEGAFAVEWGSDTQFYPEAEWRRQVDILGAISNTKTAFMSHTKLMEGQSGTDNWGRPVTFGQTLWYALGSFLLGKNDAQGNSYFMFNGGSGYNRIWWFDEYDKIELGRALGTYTVTTIGGVNIYSREFERGYVYVNPTANNVLSLALPQASQLLTRDTLLALPETLPTVNAISLIGHHAAILLKTVTGPVPDTTAPSVPTGLVGTAVSTNQINLTWNPSTDNVGVGGYYVYLNDAPLGTTATTSFSHTGLTTGTTYNYRVSAYDAVPNHSAWTATPVAVTTPVPDTTAPSTPSGLSALVVSSSQINLSWATATDNIGVTGYRVYRGGTLLATLGNVTAYQNTGLAASTSYTYSVQAMDAAGNASAPSAPASATTPAAPDITPPTVSITSPAPGATVSGTIAVTANASDNVGVVGVQFKYNSVNLGAEDTAAPYSASADTTTVANGSYTLTAVARDAAGNLSTSAPVTITVWNGPIPDTTAPSVPTGLAGTAASASRINLSWNPSTDNVGVAGYYVYLNDVPLGTTTTTSFSHTGLAANTIYKYRVSAYDAVPNHSPWTALISAKTRKR